MKKLLLGLFSLLLSVSSIAQTTNDFTVEDEDGNLIPNNGNYTLIINSGTNPTTMIERKFLVRNNTNEDRAISIVRRLDENRQTEWTDEVCWPPNCYTTDGAINFTSRNCTGLNTTKVLSNSSLTNHSENGNPMPAYIKPNIYTNGGNDYSRIKYIYSLLDCESGDFLHSFTLELTYALESNTVKKNASVTIAPNPASDYVTFSVPEGSGSVQLVDVLGNIVHSSEFNGTQKINTSSYKNGVYFVTILTATERLTKKLVIKH